MFEYLMGQPLQWSSSFSPCVLVAALFFFSGKFSHYCLASLGLTFSMLHNFRFGATSGYFNSLVWLPLLFRSSVESFWLWKISTALAISQAQIFLCCHVSTFKFILIHKFLKLIRQSIELVYPTISLLILVTVETITSFPFMMHVKRGAEMPIQMHIVWRPQTDMVCLPPFFRSGPALNLVLTDWLANEFWWCSCLYAVPPEARVICLGWHTRDF